MGVEEASHAGHAREPGVHDPFQDLGEGLEQYYHAEGGGRVLGGLAQLVQDHAVGHLEGGGVEAIGHQRGKEVVYKVGSHPVAPFPQGVGGLVRARG